jgi:hypothetical protein
MIGAKHRLAFGIFVAALATVSAQAAPKQPDPAPASNVSCNDPNVSRGPGAWKPGKDLLAPLDQKLASAFPAAAAKAGIQPEHYGIQHCGVSAGQKRLILVNGIRQSRGHLICDDSANFVVLYEPAKQAFGLFHFAVSLCPPKKQPPGK